MRKVHIVIKSNQNACLKPYIDINTDLSKKAKECFWKRLSWVDGKTMENKWENIEILNLSQQKEEETIWCQKQMIILQSFSLKIY